MDPQQESLVLKAECLCKAHSFSVEVPKTRLPLEASFCHCSSCRAATGALCAIGTTWPQPRDAVDTSGLASYAFSPRLTYRFCGVCSTPIFYEKADHPGELGVFTGPLQNVDADILRFTHHLWVGDTVDGGASVWFRRPNPDGLEIPRFREEAGDLSWDEFPGNGAAPTSSAGPETSQEGDAVPVSCHCGGVRLLLHPGDYASVKREELPWYIDPRTNKRLASFDACNSCRLQFGIDMVNWTFADLSHISPAGGADSSSSPSSFPKTTLELKTAVDAGENPAVGTLAYYASSPDVQRYFCRVCSASFFYAWDGRPEMVDLAVGLLRSPDGARAERLLSWAFGDDMSWADDARGGWREGLLARIRADAEALRVARAYPKSWRRIAKEEKAAAAESS